MRFNYIYIYNLVPIEEEKENVDVILQDSKEKKTT